MQKLDDDLHRVLSGSSKPRSLQDVSVTAFRFLGVTFLRTCIDHHCHLWRQGICYSIIPGAIKFKGSLFQSVKSVQSYDSLSKWLLDSVFKKQPLRLPLRNALGPLRPAFDMRINLQVHVEEEDIFVEHECLIDGQLSSRVDCLNLFYCLPDRVFTVECKHDHESTLICSSTDQIFEYTLHVGDVFWRWDLAHSLALLPTTDGTISAQFAPSYGSPEVQRAFSATMYSSSSFEYSLVVLKMNTCLRCTLSQLRQHCVNMDWQSRGTKHQCDGTDSTRSHKKRKRRGGDTEWDPTEQSHRGAKHERRTHPGFNRTCDQESIGLNTGDEMLDSRSNDQEENSALHPSIFKCLIIDMGLDRQQD